VFTEKVSPPAKDAALETAVTAVDPVPEPAAAALISALSANKAIKSATGKVVIQCKDLMKRLMKQDLMVLIHLPNVLKQSLKKLKKILNI
jgi:hypothetical protein